MKKWIMVLLILAGLTMGAVAGAQGFNLGIRNMDLVIFVVEGEFQVMPQVSVVAGVGIETYSQVNLGLMAGVAYFTRPDHTGLYAAGRFLYIFSAAGSIYPLPIPPGLYTTGGYRWKLDANTQMDFEFGLDWPVPLRPNASYPVPMLSLGLGYRF